MQQLLLTELKSVLSKLALVDVPSHMMHQG
jgi:hypothetical protein